MGYRPPAPATGEPGKEIMPTCKEVVDVLTEYVEGDLPEADRSGLERHLADCPMCRAFLSTYRASSALARESLRAEVPEALSDRIRRFLAEKTRGGQG